MAHLAEVHISESLEHYADDIQLRAMMMQSHLENTATALLHLKSIYDSKILSSGVGTEEEEDLAIQFSSRIESLVSQARSARVVSSKSVRQLGDLKSRCVTLDPSTVPIVKQSEQSGADLVSVANKLGNLSLKLFAEEAQTEVITVQTISTALQSGQSSLSSISSKLQATTTHLHTFYNLTTSLSHAVEFPVPPSNPPWKLLAQQMKAANADLAAREIEMSRLKDEMAEKNTMLAMKEKLAEEMGVKLEVFEKRVGESSERRARLRELEEASAIAKAKEKDLLNKLSRLQSELQQADAEREKWKSNLQTKPSSFQPGQPPILSIPSETVTSQFSLQQISSLKSEIKTLQSCIRYLRTAAHTQNVSDSLDFLSTPITPAAPAPRIVQTEAKDVLKEMLGLIAQPDSQVIKLQSRSATERLHWKPAKDTMTWQIQRQREEWEEWREWRDGVAKKAALARRQKERIAASRAGADLKERIPMAKLQMHLPGKTGSGEMVKILDPAEWDDVQQTLSIKVE